MSKIQHLTNRILQRLLSNALNARSYRYVPLHLPVKAQRVLGFQVLYGLYVPTEGQFMSTTGRNKFPHEHPGTLYFACSIGPNLKHAPLFGDSN